MIKKCLGHAIATYGPSHYPIFNYHQVASKFDSLHHNVGNFTDIQKFEKHLSWMRKNYEIVSLEDLFSNLNSAKENKLASITFDDGDKSIIEAADLLKSWGVPATFFVNSSYVGNRAACWFHICTYINNLAGYEDLKEELKPIDFRKLRSTNDASYYNYGVQKVESLFPDIKNNFNMYVDWSDLENLDKKLFKIGCHGSEHQRFSMQTRDWQTKSVIDDKKRLAKFQNFSHFFAIPFGTSIDWSIDTIGIILEYNLIPLFADGGLNVSPTAFLKRIPADDRNLATELATNVFR